MRANIGAAHAVVDDFADAKVAELNLAAEAQQHVARLDVAVHDGALPQVHQCFEHRHANDAQHVLRKVRRQALDLLHGLVQRHGHELHENIQVALKEKEEEEEEEEEEEKKKKKKITKEMHKKFLDRKNKHITFNTADLMDKKAMVAHNVLRIDLFVDFQLLGELLAVLVKCVS